MMGNKVRDAKAVMRFGGTAQSIFSLMGGAGNNAKKSGAMIICWGSWDLS